MLHLSTPPKFVVGDWVVTPRGRTAKVTGWDGDGRAELKYLSEDEAHPETVALFPTILRKWETK